MEMHQVRYFLAVARTLNFTRAAEECNVTQPSLTRAVQKLEDELGGLLFRRERSLTHLTELGRAMLPHLERTYGAAQDAKALAKGIGKAQVAALHLGIASSVDCDNIHAIIEEVAQSLDGFELSATEGSSADLIERAMKGDIELLMIEAPMDAPERLEPWPLFEQQYMMVARNDHRFSERSELELAELRDEPWIDSGDDGAARLRSIASTTGMTVEFKHKVSGYRQLHRLLLSGLGTALIPRPDNLGEGLIMLGVSDKAMTAPVILAGIAGRRRSPAAEAFVRSARARGWADR